MNIYNRGQPKLNLLILKILNVLFCFDKEFDWLTEKSSGTRPHFGDSCTGAPDGSKVTTPMLSVRLISFRQLILIAGEVVVIHTKLVFAFLTDVLRVPSLHLQTTE